MLHRNATEAAKAAGYSSRSSANQGYRLLQMQVVIDRIHELEQQLETNVNVIEELEGQYAFAKSSGHTNSAIKALELLSRVRGANSDVTGSMDKETLETAIVGCLNVLGEEKVVQLLSKCDFSEGILEEDGEEDAEGTVGDSQENGTVVDIE